MAAEVQGADPSRSKEGPGAAHQEAAWSIRAEGVQHTFENGFQALEATDLRIEPGTFCTLLGPSGSGKTTLLRIFAGLLEPTGGRVHIGERDVTDVPVQDRGIGFVFQHYALFPHLSVAQNLAYPLRIQRIGKAERNERVREILHLIDLDGLGDRKPHELSGGQQQRVAVGRALVYRPKVLLLDEPLGALDRKLRQQLGHDLRRIQRELGTTTVYVTHDQEEAFLLSDQVVVMNHGRIRQIGSPESVYARPRDLFVANFLGDTNILEGLVESVGGGVGELRIGEALVRCAAEVEVAPAMSAFCSVRPEDVRVSPSAPAEAVTTLGRARVVDRVFMGSRTRLRLDHGAGQLVAELPPHDYSPEVGEEVVVWWSATPVLLEGEPQRPPGGDDA